ncbi:mechanosensitive ion channel family protein [Poseidonibacter ostreae]|jgi:potassium-dependent mechanosensitive channel|uniref:Mechanosensitive ion channel n=1 Tax=Poseidonibacter ostreae TaxID=2654171 RepID=A0A6L4WQD5_9BACT|nr:mechanosensitive ion channel domain-containing protein [Poseidonibacter ostreae]KAB7882038.1 mechanosensitive ion channel [Poseidonibacter ostreae]KAB7886629.1 mechanosensitive ion channel [Poseidonibacter ostreae]KAB7889239.1 mechanosensitive ion channel [Poseidonibacter ostreae]|tara:strand:+ start:1563 stop:3377 length:1815 start_codon:yes stop_codon:yes gene_type:complete
MKLFFLLLAFFTFTFSAQIDVKLYDKANSNNYYQEIENIINKSKTENTKADEIINEEKTHLKKLIEISTKKVSIEEFNLNLLKDEKVSSNTLIKALLHLSNIKVKSKKQNEFKNDIQNKLSFLKKAIENITEDKKNFLLSYQLQFAYYKLLIVDIEDRILLFSTHEKELENSIISSIKKVVIKDVELIEKELSKINENVNKLLLQKAAFEIELEKEIINENKNNIELSKTNINKIETLYQNELLNSIKFLSKKVVYSLKNSDEKEFLKIYNEIEKLIVDITSDNKSVYLEQNILFKSIAKQIFGNTKLFISDSISQSKDYLLQIKDKLTSTLFVFNEQAISFISLLKSLFLIFIGFTIGYLYKKWIYKLSTKWPNMSQMSLKLSANVGYYLIVLITFMIAMSSLGIDMSSISLIAGALSIGIGFGLQTVVSNFIAGIILMFERTIRIGDIIEINNLITGTVSDIRIRSTTVKTFDNIDIVVPNSSFIQNNVINWTLDDATRRLHIPFGVAYGTKVEKVKEVIIKELLESDLRFLRNDENKLPEIRLSNMNASSVDFELLVWVKANDRLKPNALKSDFLILIYNSLYKYEIEIPFPQLDLHLKKK